MAGPNKDTMNRDEAVALMANPAALRALATQPRGVLEASIADLPLHLARSVRACVKDAAPKPQADPAPKRLPTGPIDWPPVLVSHGASGAYWVRAGDAYHAVHPTQVQVELTRCCPSIEWTIGDELRPMSTIECYAVAGHRVERVILDMSARTPAIEGDALVLPCCRLTPIVPQWSDRVDEWLQRLAGEDYPRVLDWVSHACTLDTPIAALYLDGPGGAGKGLFASALAAQWGGARASYADVALSGWTSPLRETPVVHLDERAPRDMLDQGSAVFRTLVGESERPMIEKNRPAATIRGCIRLLVTANGPDALRIGVEDLSPDDEAAIGVRIIHVRIGDDAVAYLEEIGGRMGTHGWAGPTGEAARHFRWLMTERAPATTGKRLLVEGTSAEWLRGAALREGLPRDILVALARACSGADRHLDESARPARYFGGAAWVACEALQAQWLHLTGIERVPSHRRMGEALLRIGPRSRVAIGGERPWLYRVPVEMVISAAQSAGVGDVDDIRRRCGKEGT